MVSPAMIRMCVQIGSMLVTVALILGIKFNDLAHLNKIVNKIDGKVDELAERVAKIEGILTRIKNSRR